MWWNDYATCISLPGDSESQLIFTAFLIKDIADYGDGRPPYDVAISKICCNRMGGIRAVSDADAIMVWELMLRNIVSYEEENDDVPYVTTHWHGQFFWRGIHPPGGTFNEGGWEKCVNLWTSRIHAMVDAMNEQSKEQKFDVRETTDEQGRPNIFVHGCTRTNLDRVWQNLSKSKPWWVLS